MQQANLLLSQTKGMSAYALTTVAMCWNMPVGLQLDGGEMFDHFTMRDGGHGPVCLNEGWMLYGRGVF